MKVIVSQASDPSVPHCIQFGSGQHVCQGIVICIHIECIHEIHQLWPISNKEILIYEQGILFQILSRIDWLNL